MAVLAPEPAFSFVPFTEYVLPLPAVLDAAAAALVVVLAARGRPVVLDAARLREIHADARFVLEEFVASRGTGPAPARIANLPAALRARLEGSPLLAHATTLPAEEETLFLCPDRDGAHGFVPSGR